jgi:hypothetical protein
MVQLMMFSLAHDSDLQEAAGPSALDNIARVVHDRSGIERGDTHDEKT